MQLEIAIREQRANAGEELADAIEHRIACVRTRHHVAVVSRALPRRDERDGLVRIRLCMLHVREIALVNPAIRRPVVNDRAERHARVPEHQCQALRDVLHRIGSATAPGIERIHGRQLRVEDCFERGHGVRCQFRERHADIVRKIDKQLSLTAGVVQCHQSAGTNRVHFREHDQHRRELVLVASSLHAVAIEQRFVGGVDAGDGTRV